MNKLQYDFKNVSFFFSRWLPPFVLLIFFIILLGASQGGASEDKTWFFEFEKSTIADILTRISTTSESEIVLEGQIPERIISRSYKEKTILHILRDVVQGNNYAIVMGMKGDHVESYHIKTVGQGKKSDHKSNDNVTQTFFRGAEKSIHPGGQAREKMKKTNHYFSKNNSGTNRNNTISMPLPPMPKSKNGLEVPPMPPFIAFPN